MGARFDHTMKIQDKHGLRCTKPAGKQSHVACPQSKQLWFQVSTKPSSADTMIACTLSLMPAVSFCAMFVTLSRQWLRMEDSVTLTVFQYICNVGQLQQCDIHEAAQVSLGM